MKTFKEQLHLPVTRVDDSERMLARLAGLTDPEAKRKAIGAEFIDVFNEFAGALEKELSHRPRFLVQASSPQVVPSATSDIA